MAEIKRIPLPRSLQRLTDMKTGLECVYPKHLYTVDNFSSALQYKADPSDVFVCSFSKSGTTWLQYIVWLIIHHGQDLPESKGLSEVIPMLEFDGCDVTKAMPNDEFPRIVKTHFRRSLVPYHAQTKYIYIARNPKDVLVSYLYHCRGFECYYGAPDLQIDEIFESFAHGEVEFGNHTEHVAEWYAARDEINVLFLLYEDLKEDLEREVLKVAAFLGTKYFDELMKDGKKLVREIVEKTSFTSMSSTPDSKWVSWR